MVDEKELEILIIDTIATLKRKKQKMWTEGSLVKFVKDSVETGLRREYFGQYFGQLISKKSVNYSTVNSRECLRLSKNEIKLVDSNNNNTISHDNNISHDDTEAAIQRCTVKKVFLEISQNSQENTCA